MKDYIIYPEARGRIESTGLGEKIRKKAKENRHDMPSPYIYLRPKDIFERCKELKASGYYKKFPQDFFLKYSEIMNRGMTPKMSELKWKVSKEGNNIEMQTDPSEIMMYTGLYISSILSPDEIWDLNKYQFNNISNLIATVSAYIFETIKPTDGNYDGYKWELKKNGKTYVSVLPKGGHGDFRAYKTELTPYPTIDIFGNNVELRPKLKEDVFVISGYHSVETDFLMMILKWIEMACIKSDIIDDDGKNIREFLRSIGNKELPPFLDESIYGKMSLLDKPEYQFFAYVYPLKDYEELGRTQYSIGTEFGGSYKAGLGKEKELKFAYFDNKMVKENAIEPRMTYFPEEADELLKSLFWQCNFGLGRTNVDQLLAVFDYYLKNRKELKKLSKAKEKELNIK